MSVDISSYDCRGRLPLCNYTDEEKAIAARLNQISICAAIFSASASGLFNRESV